MESMGNYLSIIQNILDNVIFQPQAVQGYTTSKFGQWNSDTFDCFRDVGICLCGAFFPMCVACKVAQDYGECCCLPLMGGTILALRTGIRERYHIQGTICTDCLCVTFCGPCALCQMARELESRR
uniref:Novel protein similar to cornifelin n=1 Tax=Xenopus tropicalis TaxID=8364 RepID=F7BW80_XENTR